MNADQLTSFTLEACKFNGEQLLSLGVDSTSLSVVVATALPDIATTVLGWVVSDDEWAWLGGNTTDPRLAQIEAWVHNPTVGSFVLMEGDNPAAFMNIDSYPPGAQLEHTLELGRLIVAPSKRDQRFGTILLDHLSNCLASFISMHELNYHIHGRRVRGNDNAKQFLRHSRSLRQAPPYDNLRDDSHTWYDFGSPDIKKVFSEALRHWREKKKMSRLELAQRAKISNTMITAYEKGTKLPKLETLVSISRVLAETPLEWAKVVTSFLNPNTSSLILQAATVSDELENTKVDMYVFTDTLGEIQRDSFLRETVEAIRNGYMRYYFIDNPRLKTDLLFRLKRSGLSDKEIKTGVQIYLAPRILCCLRLALRSGTSPNTQVATLAPGSEDHRVYLTQDLAETLISRARDVIGQFDTSVPRGEVEGFSQLFPSDSMRESNNNEHHYLARA